MTKLGIALFALLFLLSLSAVAQNTGAGQQPADQQGSASQGQTQQPTEQQGSMSQETTTTGKKMHGKTHLKGKVSEDGKTFIDKDGKSWTIENPDAVGGHEGQEVSLRAHVDKKNNSISVTSVKMSGEKTKDKTGKQMPANPPQE